MSLEIVRQVNAQHPALLQQNVNRTCYQFVVHVIAALKAAGHEAYHVCKSPGEGQYTPPGFAARTVTGLDGKDYPCSGVSHDALWSDGQQFDTVARGNDSPDPIFNADGSRMTGEAVWNMIPSQYHRPNNPPLKDGAPTPQPVSQMPSYEDLGGDAFFRSAVGVPLAQDAALANDPLNDGSAVWFSRPIFRIIEAHLKGGPVDAAGIVKSVREEWRALMPKPPNGWPPL